MSHLSARLAILCFGICFTLGSVWPASAQAPGWLEKDFRELSALFEGRWDNERHGFFAGDSGLDPASLSPMRTHIIVEAEGTDEPLTSRFVVRTETGEILAYKKLSVDPARNMIVQTSYGADGQTARNCEVIWRRFAGQFEADGTGPECVDDETVLDSAPISAGPQRLHMALSQTDFWILQASDGHSRETRFRKARLFVCWTSLLRGARHGDSGEGSDDWMYRDDVTLHDQGGVAVLESDETPSRQIKLLLRDVDWTYGTNRASLVLYIYENINDTRAASYAWAEAGAERIGINLRWIQASCTLTSSKTPYIKTDR